MPKVVKQKNHEKKRSVHPNSRKAGKLAKAAGREEKLHRNRIERTKMLKATVGETVSWFKDNLHSEKTLYTFPEACELIDSFLHRFDEELTKMNVQNNIKGRQKNHNAREEAIKTTMDHEKNLFDTCGLEVPDITNAKNVQILRSWDEDVRSLNTIKMRKFTSQDAQKQVKSVNSDMNVE